MSLTSPQLSLEPKVLLIEDDLRLSELVRQYLSSHGFRVSVVNHGDKVLEQVQTDPPDIIVLDLGLPGRDGFSICQQLRPTYANPILILTARDNDSDQIMGFELGADDYVIKPIEPRVLLVRINALLRRRPTRAHEPQVLHFGHLHIDLPARSVTLGDQAVELSSHEFDLLLHLAAHAGVTQSREILFSSLCGRDYEGTDRLLDVRISHLRRKLGDDASRPHRIKTIWGQGYLFVPTAW